MRNKYIRHLPKPSRTKKNEGKQHKKDVTMQVGGVVVGLDMLH
jgi:hypothetical protein